MCQAAPVAERLWADVHAAHPATTFLGIVGDQAHSLRRSSHNCGSAPGGQESPIGGVAYDPDYAHALDIGVGTDRDLALAIIGVLVDDPRTRYCIYDGDLYYPDGDDEPDADATGHPTHVHWSGKPGTTRDTRPFKFATEDIDIMDAATRAYFDAKFIALLAAIQKVGDELHAQAQRHNAAERARDEQHPG